ncbi:hypothetical protein OB920_09660 [Halobacteria archaeon HArc-gm2]|nr:hypothetical protein [Halobacteria archaeon HArc-gm2]
MALQPPFSDLRPWMLAGYAFVAFIVGLRILVAYWVYRDASARGSSNPRSWGVWVVIVDLVVLSYLYNRWRKLGERNYPRTTRDRAVETTVVAGYGAFISGALLAPADFFLTPLYTVGGLAVTLPLAYLLVYRGGWARLRDAV